MDMSKPHKNKVRPGFESTKGNRVTDAMSELCKKMELLEKARLHLKESGQTTDTGESLCEVQCKLLDLQVKLFDMQQHMFERDRFKKLEKEHLNIPADDHETMNNLCGSDTCDANEDLDKIPVKLEKETQTSKANSIILTSNNQKSKTTATRKCPDDMKASKPVSDERVNSAPSSSKDQDVDSKLVFSNLETCRNSHYHSKISDVPFVVGTSCSPSYSVIANIQNIISIMKTHNKFLCHPTKDAKSCRKIPKSTRETFEFEEMRITMRRLVEELSALAQEQAELRKLLHGEPLDTKSKTYVKYKGISRRMESKAEELHAIHVKLSKNKKKKTDSRVKPATSNEKFTSHPAKKVDLRQPINRRLMQALRQTKDKLESSNVTILL